MLPDERYSAVALAVALVALPPFELQLVLLFLSSSFRQPPLVAVCSPRQSLSLSPLALSSLPQSSVYY